jgi:hypothetical protein
MENTIRSNLTTNTVVNLVTSRFFSRKHSEYDVSWQVFWLVPFVTPSRELPQWQQCHNVFNELTAAGTTPDFHRIPF